MTSAGNWRALVAWGGVCLLAAMIAISFILWGLNGPAYLVDLVAAYCL